MTTTRVAQEQCFAAAQRNCQIFYKNPDPPHFNAHKFVPTPSLTRINKTKGEKHMLKIFIKIRITIVKK
jgi:hypothetical protein